MKLTFDFKEASVGKAHGIALHNARAKGHYEGNLVKPGKIGGIRSEDIKKNIELVPIQSFKEKDWIGDRKIVGGRQSKAKETEFTTWMIQAGGINNPEKKLDTLPLKENIKFLKESHEWLVKKFGIDNIKSSHIHLDETTPQLQVVMSNIVEREDGKIYLGKGRTFGYQGLTQFQTRIKAKQLQQEFHNDVAKKYGIKAQEKELGTKGKVGQAEFQRQEYQKELKRIDKNLKMYDYFEKSKDIPEVINKTIKAMEQLHPEVAKAVKVAIAKKIKKPNKGIER